jgi:hypothetical protein
MSHKREIERYRIADSIHITHHPSPPLGEGVTGGCVMAGDNTYKQ